MKLTAAVGLLIGAVLSGACYRLWGTQAAVAAGLDPKHFPPIPTAAGFLGVLLPLLFFEVRLIR